MQKKTPKWTLKAYLCSLNIHIWSITWLDLVRNVVFSYNLNNKGSLLAFIGNKMTLKAYLVNDAVGLVKNVVFSYIFKKEVFYWHLWFHLELLTSMKTEGFHRRFFIEEKGTLQYRQSHTIYLCKEQNQNELSMLICAFLVNNVVTFIQRLGRRLIHIINLSLLASVVKRRTVNIHVTIALYKRFFIVENCL